MRERAFVEILVVTAFVSSGLFSALPVHGDEISSRASQEIRSIRSRFNEAIRNHDAASIAAFLDSEYQITTSSGEHHQATPEDEVAAWEEIFRERKDVVYLRSPELVEVSSYNDLAAESGTWTGSWSGPEGSIEIGGKYFAQWRNVGGKWKIRAEIFVGLFCEGSGC
jgi:ketosteroid isomerase-like protein